jgi:hypothetical protein
MPRSHRQSRKRKGSSDRRERIVCEVLRRGYSIETVFGEPEPTEAELEQCWERYGDEIVAEWVEQQPGSRPWGWWRFEAPEVRQRVDGVHPFDDPSYQQEADRYRRKGWIDLMATTFGVPKYQPGDWWAGFSRAEYEDEWSYLDRHGLLTDQERFRADSWQLEGN